MVRVYMGHSRICDIFRWREQHLSSRITPAPDPPECHAGNNCRIYKSFYEITLPHLAYLFDNYTASFSKNPLFFITYTVNSSKMDPRKSRSIKPPARCAVGNRAIAAIPLIIKLMRHCSSFPLMYHRKDKGAATDAVCIRTQIPPREMNTENSINWIVGSITAFKLQQPFDNSRIP